MSELINGEALPPELAADPWFEDFKRGCSRAAHLYATAFDRLVVELGDEGTAMALAPTVLPQVMAMAEAEASHLEAMRHARAAAERERVAYEAAQQRQQRQREQGGGQPW